VRRRLPVVRGPADPAPGAAAGPRPIERLADAEQACRAGAARRRARRADGATTRLAETLARLAERRVHGVPAEVAPAPRRLDDASTHEPLGVDSFLPGGVLEGPRGRCYLHERLRSEIEKPQKGWGRYHAPAAALHPELAERALRGLDGAVFLDLETCGLSNAPVFLAGTMHWNGEDYVLRQYFARDYSEEPALVDELTRFLAGFETVITYNGKSYDVPFLGDRAALHHVPFERPAHHVDLVHHARRRWAEVLPNCRLVTVELHVRRRRRVGDVSGAEVPDLYHDFVKYGAQHRLIPVFHHNLLDVITMDEILRALIEDPDGDRFEGMTAAELE
jgi:uncharacterized protein YprB with RNaseH-like and TPR domain